MSTFSVSYKELFSRKLLLRNKLKMKLPFESILKAENDWHAKRKLRPCGLTVHSAIGCNVGCIYCYIGDMGFSTNYVEAYGLNGEELVYALLSNKYFLPGETGTYLAFGSVTEPFHPIAKKKTLEYITAVSKYLKNPIQISTKFPISKSEIKIIKTIKSSVNFLITIITLNKAKMLEPHAPSVESRLDFISLLRKEGFKPMLFLRPLIPGVNIDEAEDLLREAKKKGAVAAVIGGFRVTPTILSKLKKHGLNVERILARLRGSLRERMQVPVKMADIKSEIVKLCIEIGLIPFKSACCANTYNIFLSKGIRIPCINSCWIKGNFCTQCPVNCSKIEVKFDVDELSFLAEKLLNVKVRNIEAMNGIVKVYVGGLSRSKLHKHKSDIIFLKQVYRREIEVIGCG